MQMQVRWSDVPVSRRVIHSAESQPAELVHGASHHIQIVSYAPYIYVCTMASKAATDPISISPLLQALASPDPSIRQHVSAVDIAAAFALIFENRISHTQMAAFLALLHSTGLDREPSVIASCAEKMRDAAVQVDKAAMSHVLADRGDELRQGRYHGGFVSSYYYYYYYNNYGVLW